MHYGYFDGACAGNPGRIGLGVCICDEEREIFIAAGPYQYGTNNDAEYLALIKLLEYSLQLGIAELTVMGDSQLIINHVNGKWSAGDKFKAMLAQVMALKNQFKTLYFGWIPRTRNTRADKLSKRGLELAEWKSVHKREVVTEVIETEVQSKEEQQENPKSEQAKELVVKKSFEVRLARKFGVYVDVNNTYLIDFTTGKCTCGEQGCEHFEAVKGKKAA